MASHTPGPWGLYDQDKPTGQWIGAESHIICEQPVFGPESIKAWANNAPLIVAAPAMLALLQELIDIEGPQPGTSEWAAKVKATIADATGGA